MHRIYSHFVLCIPRECSNFLYFFSQDIFIYREYTSFCFYVYFSLDQSVLTAFLSISIFPLLSNLSLNISCFILNINNQEIKGRSDIKSQPKMRAKIEEISFFICLSYKRLFLNP